MREREYGGSHLNGAITSSELDTTCIADSPTPPETGTTFGRFFAAAARFSSSATRRSMLVRRASPATKQNFVAGVFGAANVMTARPFASDHRHARSAEAS